MGRSTRFEYGLWAIAPNQLPQHRSKQQFLKAFHILKRDCDGKKCMYINRNKPDLYHSCFKALVSTTKIGSLQWPMAQNEFPM
jgi:hypothetical protein